MISTIFAGLLAVVALGPDEPRAIPLWPNAAPGSEARRGEPEQAKDYWVRNVHNPSILPGPDRHSPGDPEGRPAGVPDRGE